MKNLNDILWDKESVEDILENEQQNIEKTSLGMGCGMQRGCLTMSCPRDNSPVGAYNSHTTIKCY